MLKWFHLDEYTAGAYTDTKEEATMSTTSTRRRQEALQYSEMSDVPYSVETSDDELPPTDHGRGAYIALACCTIAQAPIWGKRSLFQCV